jgi:DnaJ-class molecular chaperone
MVVDTTLYNLLGVSPDVNESDLRKALLKKARDHDLEPQEFEAINEAYNILKDQKKRRQYDQYGMEGLRESGSLQSVTLFDLYNGKEVSPKRERERQREAHSSDNDESQPQMAQCHPI